LAQITMALSGRISEEIQFGDVTTGASNDFEKATELARRMVTQYGMSESLGPIQYGRGSHQVFLGRDFGDERNYSEEVASKIDTEVRRIIDECYDNATKILRANWDKVERMVSSLLEHETVDREEVACIINGRPYPEPKLPADDIPEIPKAAAASIEPEHREMPRRLPPNISPEPA
jgi:cell division protease FtsH